MTALRPALVALLSHWRRHPVQALTLVIGLALATGLWTGVQAINAQARDSYARAAGVEHNVINGGDAAMSFVEVELKE